MTAAVATCGSWLGDPALIVYATRYALGARGGHVPEFVRQSIEANAPALPSVVRRAIVRDVRDWLGDAGAKAAPADRAVWVAALASLGVVSA